MVDQQGDSIFTSPDFVHICVEPDQEYLAELRAKKRFADDLNIPYDLVEDFPFRLLRYTSLAMQLCSFTLAKRDENGINRDVSALIAYFVLFSHLVGHSMNLSSPDIVQIIDFHAHLTARITEESNDDLLFVSRWFSDEFFRISQEQDRSGLSFAEKCVSFIEITHAEAVDKGTDDAYIDSALAVSFRAVNGAVAALLRA